MPLTGTYWAQVGVQAIYGTFNVAQWSQKDNDVATLDTTALQNAGDRVDRYFNRRLRENDYASPLPSTSSDMPYMTDLGNELVGVYLYQGRVGHDADEGMDGAIAGHHEHAEAELNRMMDIGIDDNRQVQQDGGVSVVTPCNQTAPGTPTLPRVPWIW